MDLRDSLEGVPLRRPWADVIHFRVLGVGECVIERVHYATCVCHVIIVFTVAPLGTGHCWRGNLWGGRDLLSCGGRWKKKMKLGIN